MKKLYIVKSTREFERIIKNGKLNKNKNYVIYSMENNLPYERYGISVGKKIGNAVYRNKYKRKVRQIIDNCKKSYVKNRDYIIILRESAKNCTYQELNLSFSSLINNIRKDLDYDKIIKKEK